jgi:hypothetical protein
MLLTVITSVNKFLPTVLQVIVTVGRTLLTEVITVSNIRYPLAAVKVIVTVGRTLLTEVITVSNIL